MNSASTQKPTLPLELFTQLHTLTHHYERLICFLGLYGVAATISVYLATILPTPWLYLVGSPFYLLAAASLHGISLFTHEGVHGVLDQKAWRNRLLSMLCALPVLQNFSAYRVLHLQHHRNLGAEGDPDHYKNYTRWTGLLFLMYWGRLLIGYPIYITAIPILGFRQGDRSDRGWILVEVMLLISMVTLGVIFLPVNVLIHAWLIPMVIINTIVNIRGMSQHTLLEQESDVIRGTRSILADPVTRFFMCNENYHLEHHLYPGVPWYHLPMLHSALRDHLIEQNAPYISSYMAFVKDFAVTGLRRCYSR